MLFVCNHIPSKMVSNEKVPTESLLVELNLRKQASLAGRSTTLEQKRSFWPDFGLLGPNLGHNFFWRF